MATNERRAPAPRLPTTEIIDRGTVRLGSGNISASLPVLKLPTKEIADRGTVRLGSGNISASFPTLA
jgi:hypothetical protein